MESRRLALSSLVHSDLNVFILLLCSDSSIQTAGIQNPDIIGAQAQSPANAQPWEYDGISNSKLPRASETPGATAAMYRRGAEQGATDFGEGPNQSSIGCLLLSINPPLLKQMSGNYSLDLQEQALRVTDSGKGPNQSSMGCLFF